jgi:ABC-type sugar transport system substrate-binding protein
MTADQQNVMQGRIAVNVMVHVLNGDKVPELIVPPIREVTAENIGTVDWSLTLPPPVGNLRLTMPKSAIPQVEPGG